MLKLDKQSGGTIYQPFLGANEALGFEGVGYILERWGAVHKPRLLRELTSRWLRVGLSSLTIDVYDSMSRLPKFMATVCIVEKIYPFTNLILKTIWYP